MHHFDLERTAHVLEYLSRHVRESRISVDSRIEVPLPPAAQASVVLRLAVRVTEHMNDAATSSGLDPTGHRYTYM